jgi:putative transposase
MKVFLKINGVMHFLWRAVYQNGVVLDILVQPKRDRLAAIHFFRKLLHVTGRRPRVTITDKLRNYATAKRIVTGDIAHRRHCYLNNRAENSINRHVSGRGECDGSSPLSMCKVSSKCAASSPPTFIPEDRLLPAADYRRRPSKPVRICCSSIT